MSEDIEAISLLVVGLIIGLPAGMLVNSIIFPPLHATDFIEEIKQAQEDCKIKEYYYMDSHRSFCDKLGVTP